VRAGWVVHGRRGYEVVRRLLRCDIMAALLSLGKRSIPVYFQYKGRRNW
jgi:hypothetical protein